MNIGLYSGVSAGRANERRLEAITANLANVDTPAYKRAKTSTKAFRLPGAKPGEFGLTTSSTLDFTQGALKSSSSPYHLGLMGQGFFAVEGPEGEMYTRDGQFHVNDRGLLQTPEGYPVAWERLAAPIDPTGDIITIDGIGTVRQGAEELGRIKFVDFEDPAGLQVHGGGYYEAQRGSVEKPSDATVHQHQLESSNVSSIDELVAMITIQRSFENAKTVMTLIDQSYGRLTQIR